MADEQLRNMLNNLINEKSAEATIDFHQYLTEQVKSIVGLSEGEKNDVLKKLLDPKINWWEQIDDVKKAYNANEIEFEDVETWSKKIDKDKNVSSVDKFRDGVYLIPNDADYIVEDIDTDEISSYLYNHITDEIDFEQLEKFAKKNASRGISIISAYNGGTNRRTEVAFVGCKPSEIKVLSSGLQQHYTKKDFDMSLVDDADSDDVSNDDMINAKVFADAYFGGLEKFMKDYGVSEEDAMKFLDIEAPNIVNILETSKGVLMAIAEND